MGQIEVFSPAKINLFLSVLGKMASGFHELVSLVAPVSCEDRLEISVQAGPASVSLSCDDASLPTDERNLCYAAAAGFLARFGLERKVCIRLEKRIPHGAGLGGGSSNAAATLEGLAALCGVEDADALMELAASLGSDCPLFLKRKPVLMRGRGEVLEDLDDAQANGFSGLTLVLLKPSFAIATAWAYRGLSLRPEHYDGRDWAEGRVQAWKAGRLPLEQLLYNSFEPLAFRKFPALAEMRRRVVEDAGAAFLMSGSGSCCFALCRSEEQRERVAAIAREDWGDCVFVRSAFVL